LFLLPLILPVISLFNRLAVLAPDVLPLINHGSSLYIVMARYDSWGDFVFGGTCLFISCL